MINLQKGQTGVSASLRFVSLIVPLVLIVFFGVSSHALADCEDLCSSESQITGLVHPPAWAAGKAVHFEPESAAAASAQGYLTPKLGEGLVGNEQLLYKKGIVEHSPKVYVIFWGSNIENTQAGNETYNMLGKLYEGLSGTAWLGTLSQYFDETGRVGGTVTLAARYIDRSVAAPKELRYESEITAEVEKAISVNKWTNEESAQFVVVTAPGTTYYNNGSELFAGSCAWHSVTGGGESYDFVPYQGDEPLDKGGEGCVATGNPSKNPVYKTSKSASHEFSEAATDPKITAWLTKGGSEVADLCSSEEDFELSSGAWVQPLYDNDALLCTEGVASPPHNYAQTVRLICRRYSSPTRYTAEFVVYVDPENESGGGEYWFEWTRIPPISEGENAIRVLAPSGYHEIRSKEIEVPASMIDFRIKGIGWAYGETRSASC